MRQEIYFFAVHFFKMNLSECVLKVNRKFFTFLIVDREEFSKSFNFIEILSAAPFVVLSLASKSEKNKKEFILVNEQLREFTHTKYV